MGDENLATDGFLYRSVDDGISLSGGDDMEVWHGVLHDEAVTIALKPHWWALNNLYKLVIGRPKYTVPMLRRWNKGHGRK